MSDTGPVSGIDILRNLSNRHDPSTESYGLRLLRDAIAVSDAILILEIYIVLARFYSNALGNAPKAMEYANLAEKIASENKVSLHVKADMCLMIAAIYKLMAQYHKAIQRCNEGIDYIRNISIPTAEDKALLYGAYLNLGMLQLQLGLKKLGVASVQQALKMSQELGDKGGVVRCKITIAKNFVTLKRFHDALAIYIEIEPDEVLLGSDDNRAIFRDYIGATYMEVGMYEEAEKYLLESLAIRRKGLQPVKQIHPLDALAKLYFRQSMTAQGDVYMKEALELADQHDAYFTKRVKAAMKYELYRDRGDHAIAQKYMADIELSNVDADTIERTIESMMDTERNKQQAVQEEAAMLKALNEEMQLHTRQLKDVNTDLQSYARTASHDLREPLRMISTYMTILFFLRRSMTNSLRMSRNLCILP